MFNGAKNTSAAASRMAWRLVSVLARMSNPLFLNYSVQFGLNMPQTKTKLNRSVQIWSADALN